MHHQQSTTLGLNFVCAIASVAALSCGSVEAPSGLLSETPDEAVLSQEAKSLERCNPYYGILCKNNNFCGGGSTGQDNPGGFCGFRPPFPQGPVGTATVGDICNAYDRVYCAKGLLCTNSGQFESGRCVRPSEPLRNPERIREAGEACNQFYAVVCKWPNYCAGQGGGELAAFINGVCTPNPLFAPSEP
jgi:hypothetical protein